MTQFTNVVAVGSDGWISLGAGPLTVAAKGPEWPLVGLIVSDTKPTVGGAQGEPLRQRRFFGTSSTVWAIALGAPTAIVVTAPDSGDGGNVTTKDAQLVPAGVYQTTVSTTAQSLAALIGTSPPVNARLVYIEPEGADIRFRDDGSAPTTTTGVRIYAGVAWPYSGALTAIQLIAVTGSVTVNLAFYK